MDQAESKILAKLKSQSKVSYDKVKETEASAGGRSLPGGLQDALGQVTDAKLGETDKKGEPYFFLYTSCVEPEEYKGVFTGIFYALTGNQWRTEEQQVEALVSDLKLLGLDEIVDTAEDLGDMLVQAIKYFKENKPQFLFNTGRRARNDGSYSIFIQGVPEGGTPPTKKESSSSPTHSSPSSSPENTEWVPATGDRVTTTDDYFESGEEYEGVVKSANKRSKVATVTFDDGEENQVPFANLALVDDEQDNSAPFDENDDAQDSSSEIEVDDKVSTTDNFFGDGVAYTGTVTEVDGNDITVVFDDDGAEMVVPLGNLELVS